MTFFQLRNHRNHLQSDAAEPGVHPQCFGCLPWGLWHGAVFTHFLAVTYCNLP
jgi:hypothetical protein